MPRYLIKLFYFDVVDDSEMTNWLHHGGLRKAQHALDGHHLPDRRWRGSVWLATHVVLVAAVCAEGVAINQLLLPWDGYPQSDVYSVLRARYQVVLPITTILWVLCLQQSTHKGTGHNSRAIGRKKRLAMRAATGGLILLLPLLTYLAHGMQPWTSQCEASEASPPAAPPLANATAQFPEWGYFPHSASRGVFFLLLFSLLLGQLAIEVYGRNVYISEDKFAEQATPREAAGPPGQPPSRPTASRGSNGTAAGSEVEMSPTPSGIPSPALKSRGPA